MNDSAIYDTKNCPRCGEPWLRCVGNFPDNKGGGMGGNHYSCSRCHGWFSVIELRRKPGLTTATFKPSGGAA